MRVMVWPPGLDGDGVSEARLLQPARVLIAAGHDVVIDRVGPTIQWSRRWEGERPPLDIDVLGLDRKPECDVVVISRPGRKFWAQVIPHLQAAGIRVVVDVDDRFDRIHPRHPGYREYHPQTSPHHNFRWIAEACRLADLVTVSTRALLGVYGFGHGLVLPNAVPARYLATEPAQGRREAVGWSGRLDTHQGDLEVTGGAVQRALAATGWGFHVIGTGKGVQEALGLAEEPSTTEGWVHYNAYPAHLAELGVGIVPLADSAFNEAKSALKLMELSAVGVPTVATPNPDNARMLAQGVGMGARSPQQWYKRLRQLIGSAELRAEVAGRSREALAGQTYEERAGEWLHAWDPSTQHKRASGRVPAVAKPSVFLGIITCERPHYLSIVLDGYRDHIAPLVDELCIVHDGEPSEATIDACGPEQKVLVATAGERKGVAAAKNRALKAALASGAEWIFLLEDDVVPQSPRAIAGYLEAATAAGHDHLQFHAHGPLNTSPVGTDGPVTYWHHFIGAYCLFSRKSIEVGGLFDEQFVNAWEHVEHSLRLAQHGFCPYPEKPGLFRVPDATGSEEWLSEIPGSIKNSAILRLWPDIHDRQAAGLRHWKATYPDTYSLVFTDPPNG